MSPRRPSVSGLTFRTWMNNESARAIRHYKKRKSPSSGNRKSPRTAASLARLHTRAWRVVNTARGHNNATVARNTARVKKMLKEIENYKARRSHKLVHNPNGTFSLARKA